MWQIMGSQRSFNFLINFVAGSGNFDTFVNNTQASVKNNFWVLSLKAFQSEKISSENGKKRELLLSFYL